MNQRLLQLNNLCEIVKAKLNTILYLLVLTLWETEPYKIMRKAFLLGLKFPIGYEIGLEKA